MADCARAMAEDSNWEREFQPRSGDDLFECFERIFKTKKLRRTHAEELFTPAFVGEGTRFDLYQTRFGMVHPSSVLGYEKSVLVC